MMLRIHDLAAEFGVSSEFLFSLLEEMDIHVRSHLSPLLDEQVALLRARWMNERRRREASPVAPKRALPGNAEQSPSLGASKRPERRRKTTTQPVAQSEAPTLSRLQTAEAEPLGRWSAETRREVVLRLLRGEAVDAVSREFQAPAQELELWRCIFLETGTEGLKKHCTSSPGPTRVPDIVIRPSGVWNSRAPFLNFLRAYQRQSRAYNALYLSIRQSLKNTDGHDKAEAARVLFPVCDDSRAAERAWAAYTDGLGAEERKVSPQPTIQHLGKDLRVAVRDLREAAIRRLFSLFEAYAQCWALNYLLMRLENDKNEGGEAGWREHHKRLAAHFSPIKGGHVPDWMHILKGIPEIKSRLLLVPHVKVDRSTGRMVKEPVSKTLNAFCAIEFWRNFRNLLVHKDGVVSQKFLNEQRLIFEELRKPYGDRMPPLKKQKRVVVTDNMYRAMSTVYYVAALSLKEWLQELSHDRRGHSFAPGPRKAGHIRRGRPPALLVEGDHVESFRWVSDESFRKQFSALVGAQSR